MNGHERDDWERELAAEYAIDAFFEGASDDEIREYWRTQEARKLVL